IAGCAAAGGILVFVAGLPRTAKTGAASTCTTAAGTRPSIRWDGTSGPSGRFRSPSFVGLTSPSSRKPLWKPAFSPVARRAVWCSTRSLAAGRYPSWLTGWVGNISGLTASPSTAKWPSGGWRPQRMERQYLAGRLDALRTLVPHVVDKRADRPRGHSLGRKGDE